MANRHTQDPGNTNRDGTRNGGRYDRFTLRDLVPAFSAAAAALQPDEISQVFETEFGYHVMRLNSREGDRISFNHVLIPISAEGSETGAAFEELTVLRDSLVTHSVPFEAIARRHSEDEFSAFRGGFVSDPRTGERDLRLEALGPEWQVNVDTLEIGEISHPTEVNLLDGTEAVHIVLLQKRTPAHPLSPDIDYALLSDYALQDKRQRVFLEWIERLRRDVYIDIRSDRYAEQPTS
ncbi:MAG: peptidylprolyl isomerase [Bacteroidota bacterium]